MRPVLILDEAQAADAVVLSELRILASKDFDSRRNRPANAIPDGHFSPRPTAGMFDGLGLLRARAQATVAGRRLRRGRQPFAATGSGAADEPIDPRPRSEGHLSPPPARRITPSLRSSGRPSCSRA
jgi:hypothetical protein